MEKFYLEKLKDKMDGLKERKAPPVEETHMNGALNILHQVYLEPYAREVIYLKKFYLFGLYTLGI